MRSLIPNECAGKLDISIIAIDIRERDPKILDCLDRGANDLIASLLGCVNSWCGARSKANFLDDRLFRLGFRLLRLDRLRPTSHQKQSRNPTDTHNPNLQNP